MGMLEHIDAPYGKGVVTKGALSSCIISNPTRNDAVVMSIYKKTHPERAVLVGSGVSMLLQRYILYKQAFRVF